MAIVRDWTLEIHHIDVGGGDATAIAVKDSDSKIISRVLIDAGAEGSGSQSLSTYVTNYLQVSADNPFDYIIVSHYHNDHIDGFWQCKIPFKNYVDAGGYTLGEDKFTPVNGIGIKTSSGFFEGYKQIVAANIASNKAARTKIPFIDQAALSNGPATIYLGVGTGIKLTCYCANGVLADGTNVLATQKATKRRALNPNDLSLAWILEWEDFRYFTAGDLSGDKLLKSYYNMEESLVDYLTKLGKLPVTVLKVTHHGSEYSSYPDSDDTKSGFLDKLQPEILIVPCNISKQVPSPSFLQRANSYCTTKKASMLFVNDLYYYKSDDQYKEITNIQSNSAFSSNILVDATNGVASNNAQAVVVVRHSGGTLADVPKESTDSYFVGKGYTVIVKNGKLERKGGFITKPPKFDFGASFPTLLLDAYIVPGFTKQATAIDGWLQQDQTAGSKEGISYVQENYPAFMTTIEQKPGNLVNALVQVLTDLFNELFQEQSINGIVYYSPGNPQFNELSFEQKDTLFVSLKKNKYQPELYYYLDQKDLLFQEIDLENYREGAWNYKGEPYESSGSDKRVAKSEITSRKKSKKNVE